MKVFDWKAGSLLDSVSGEKLTNNGVVFKKTEKGWGGEFGSLNKMETTVDLEDSKRIKEICRKLKVNRLGKIINII